VKNKRIAWRLIVSAAGHSIYEFVANSGRYYQKSLYSEGSVCITRSPSETYYDNFLCDLNKGKRIKEWRRW